MSNTTTTTTDYFNYFLSNNNTTTATIDIPKLSAGLVDFLTGNFEYSSELQSFWMALQGVMIVRNGVNKDRQLHWFHAFMLSVICGYGGAAFGFIWMGKPTSLLSNDLNMASCILSFILIYYLPFDIGFWIGNALPVALVTTSFAQLFRSLGLVKFVTVAFEDLKTNPSRYYPIPIFGPILYGTMLGNMSSFFLKGFHDYLSNGMPWPFQNGLFCATFYHFYVNDTTGPIGTTMRHVMHTNPYLSQLQGGLDDRTFATAAVSLFMQVVGLLHMPILLGPNFSPFTLMGIFMYRITSGSTHLLARAAASTTTTTRKLLVPKSSSAKATTKSGTTKRTKSSSSTKPDVNENGVETTNNNDKGATKSSKTSSGGAGATTVRKRSTKSTNKTATTSSSDVQQGDDNNNTATTAKLSVAVADTTTTASKRKSKKKKTS